MGIRLRRAGAAAMALSLLPASVAWADSTTTTAADTTPPVLTGYVYGIPGYDGWYTSEMSVWWHVVDDESQVTSTTGCYNRVEYDTSGVTFTCTATSAGGTAVDSLTVKRDATPPTISGAATTAPNSNGWYNTSVAIDWTCGDAMSGLRSCPADSVFSLSEGPNLTTSAMARDVAGNIQWASVTGINIDKTRPSASASVSPPANAFGWHSSAATVSFSGTDAISGIDQCSSEVIISTETAERGVYGGCTDLAGNTSYSAFATVKLDKTAPNVSLVGGPADGESYNVASVPAAPTCDASDGLSGLDGTCSVSGYSTSPGTHTVTASVRDKAGNSSSTSVTYSVTAWTTSGFYSPVDMNGVLNTVKGGQTVALKFEVFEGSAELTSTEIVSYFRTKEVTCGSIGTAVDGIETTTSGRTDLRYDETDGQFIQFWQTPKTAGTCVVATIGLDDGGSISAYFELR